MKQKEIREALLAGVHFINHQRVRILPQHVNCTHSCPNVIMNMDQHKKIKMLRNSESSLYGLFSFQFCMFADVHVCMFAVYNGVNL